MIYYHRFRVRASLARVAEFHSHAASMPAITPPPIIVQVHHAPPILANGDEMDFTMWLGPLPVHWLARIEAVSPAGFSDRQLRGPFAEWVHRHTHRIQSRHHHLQLRQIGPVILTVPKLKHSLFRHRPVSAGCGAVHPALAAASNRTPEWCAG